MLFESSFHNLLIVAIAVPLFSVEADMQKLSHALKILSETEKQLRLSKHQTTWLTVALLQLSSIEYSSFEANDSKLCIRNSHDKGSHVTVLAAY